MSKAPDYWWRVVATGFCFAVFGIGGLALRFIAFPLLGLFVRERPARRHHARAMIHVLFRIFVGLMCMVGVVSYEVRGLERLRRPGQLILANHPSLIDVVFLMSLASNADCIVKEPLARNPFTRGPVLMADFIRNRDGPELIDAAIESVRNGSKLVIFPEGTRTPLSGQLRLQRGAANIAVRGRIDITPILIRCTPPFLTKGTKWWRAPDRRAHFIIEVRDEIAIAPFVDRAASAGIAARQVTRHLLEYFSGELVGTDA